MRLLERVDEAVVVHAFLLAELDSPRFGRAVRAALERIGAPEALVREADTGDAHANAKRRAVLDDYRGDYLGRNLDSLVWHRALYDPDEVLAIRLIAWDYWLEVSAGTRLPAAAAAYFQQRGEVEHFVPGGPPLVVVRADPGAHTMVVEGHGRLVALAMHPEELPRHVELLLGEGESVRGWSLY